MELIWLLLTCTVLIIFLLISYKYKRNQRLFKHRGISYDDSLSVFNVFTNFCTSNLTACDVIEIQCSDFKNEK